MNNSMFYLGQLVGLKNGNLCDMTGSILLDNSINKARLLTLTEQECDDLGLGVSVYFG